MRALLSVANRDGIAALARDLASLDIEMFATDGTREFLAADGIDVGSVITRAADGVHLAGPIGGEGGYSSGAWRFANLLMRGIPNAS